MFTLNWCWNSYRLIINFNLLFIIMKICKKVTILNLINISSSWWIQCWCDDKTLCYVIWISRRTIMCGSIIKLLSFLILFEIISLIFIMFFWTIECGSILELLRLWNLFETISLTFIISGWTISSWIILLIIKFIYFLLLWICF